MFPSFSETYSKDAAWHPLVRIVYEKGDLGSLLCYKDLPHEQFVLKLEFYTKQHTLSKGWFMGTFPNTCQNESSLA